MGKYPVCHLREPSPRIPPIAERHAGLLAEGDPERGGRAVAAAAGDLSDAARVRGEKREDAFEPGFPDFVADREPG